MERAAGLVNVPHVSGGTAGDRLSSARSSVAGDRMALAVCLAQRDMKNQRNGRPFRSRTPSPKQLKTRFSKGTMHLGIHIKCVGFPVTSHLKNWNKVSP